MPTPRTKRQHQYQVAKNAWQETSQNLLATTLGGPVTPPGVLGIVQQQWDFDSPPIQARATRLHKPNEGWLHLTDINLIGQDQVYGDPGQVPQAPLSQPKRLGSGVTRQDWLLPLNPNLVGQDAFYGDPGQAVTWGVTQPYPAQLTRVKSHQSWIWPSVDPLLTGQDRLYAGPGQIQPPDWTQFGVPTKYAKRLKADPAYAHAQSDVWQNPQNTILLAQDTIYGAPGQAPVYEWLVPARFIPPRANALLTHVVSLLTTTLQAQDRFYGDPGQTPSFGGLTQPQRRLPPLLQDFIATNLQSILLTPPVDTLPPGLNGVLQLFDFDPVVQARYKAQALRQYQADPWPQLLLIGQDIIYGDQGQVPQTPVSVPYPYVRRLFHDFLPPNLQSTLLAPLEDIPPGLGPAVPNLGLTQPYTRVVGIHPSHLGWVVDLETTTLAPAVGVVRTRLLLLGVGT